METKRRRHVGITPYEGLTAILDRVDTIYLRTVELDTEQTFKVPIQVPTVCKTRSKVRTSVDVPIVLGTTTYRLFATLEKPMELMDFHVRVEADNFSYSYATATARVFRSSTT